MKLYELTQEYNELQALIDNPDASNEAINQVLEQLNGQIEVKAENIAKLLKGMSTDIEGLKSEEDRLKKKRQSLENNQTRLKSYLMDQLQLVNMDKVKTPLFTISIQNNKQNVNILDESLIPDTYKTFTTTVNKADILEKIQAGEIIPGAELKQTQSIRVR